MKSAQSTYSLPLFSQLDAPRKTAFAAYRNSPSFDPAGVWSNLDAENDRSENGQLAIYAAFAIGGVVPALFLIL